MPDAFKHAIINSTKQKTVNLSKTIEAKLIEQLKTELNNFRNWDQLLKTKSWWIHQSRSVFVIWIYKGWSELKFEHYTRYGYPYDLYLKQIKRVLEKIELSENDRKEIERLFTEL